ncbi:leucine-rich repeat-containing protein 43-like isoform X2 [Sitophilus oryzae]|uniref:Leucine-rich repeat-containing protein 43-like isoform X2 n=1 Tax=Sitophilus oryzae TaxID=7048 RepID=A0A6J2YUR4_SITOR|nr:leucine-rich repeat-containing protein 43-like isoform X2 [Sitophilus oryzae]
MDSSTKLIQFPPAKNLNIQRWAPEEIVFKRKKRILEEIRQYHISLQDALLFKLRKSVFGVFLEELNSQQNQDALLNHVKFEILNYQLKNYNKHDTDIIQDRNKMLGDFRELINHAVQTCDVIDMSYLEKNLKILHLDIKTFDFTIKNFRNIQVLTLCGNYINDIRGTMLPRNLKFLELYDNFISNITNLVKGAPKSIWHLGLGRNRLTNDSRFHLLYKCRRFYHLTNLDLSDNDICRLSPLLNDLKCLGSVRSLQLEGNPCWAMVDYKNKILDVLPRLYYLDSTEILKSDREEATDKATESLPEKKSTDIVFKCYRIIGLPEPPRDSKNDQTIHLEVNFPLLIEDLPEGQDESIKSEKDIQKQEETTSISIGSKNGKNEKNEKKEKKSKEKNDTTSIASFAKPKGKKGYYSGPNEYSPGFEKRNKWFKTERAKWSKVIEFPPVVVPNLGNNLNLIRDTFRSIIPVRLVYLKTTLKKEKPKGKKEKQQKENKKKAKAKDNRSYQSNKSEECESVKVDNENAEQTETILKQITLTSFYCELKSVNWSDTSLDFYWADHPDFGDRAFRVDGSLEALQYDLTAANTSKKSKLTRSSNPNDIVITPPLPKILTCQVGFGLNRN